MAKTSEDQFGKEGFKMAKKLKKYRKNQNLSISYQAVVIDFNWRLHHNNHNPPKKISTNTEKSHEWPACAKPKPPLSPGQTPSLPTTSHLHLGPRRRASAHDICRLTSSLRSLRNRDMQLTEPWRWVNPPRVWTGFVCGRDGTRSHFSH